MGPKNKYQGESEKNKKGKVAVAEEEEQAAAVPVQNQQKSKRKALVDPNVAEAAAVSSSDTKGVSKSKKGKVVEPSLPAVETPEQNAFISQEKAYKDMLLEKVDPSVIRGNPNLLIGMYSDDPVVTAINDVTRRNQFAIQSTYGLVDEFNLSKTCKSNGECVPYNQTIRMQTLEKIGTLNEMTDTITPVQNPENLLKIQGIPIKGTIAFQQQDNNPNGVLAVALTKALDYLKIYSKNFQLVVKDEGFDAKDCESVIQQISNASRGAKAKEGGLTFKVLSNELLRTFTTVVSSGPMDEEKMKTIIGVYGSFLNKGLSDTAQGGELIKVWLLKFMEKFQPRDQPPNFQEIAGDQPYWNITCGIPYLKLLSSDKIASALYIRLINLFKGGMTSIQPYKAGGSEGSVFYLPKKYVGLIIAMITEGSHPHQIFLNFYKQCIGNLFSKLEIPGRKQYENLILKINEIIQCLYGLIENSDYMNIYDIIRVLEEKQDAIIAYLTNGDLSVLPEYMKQNYECIDLLFKANGGLYNDENTGDTEKDRFEFRIKYLKQILNCFGIFIQELSNYVKIKTNEAELEGLFNGMQGELQMSQAYSMIAETVGYYDNCMFLRGLSLQGCVQKYLQVCQEEVVCAFADVNYGHDQDIDHDVLQKLGEQFMLILCNGEPTQLPDFMKYINRTYVHPDSNNKFSRDNKYNVNEDEISKIILDQANYVSICLFGFKQIVFKRVDTADFNNDFINTHQHAIEFEEKFKIGPVCGKTFTSVDYYVARPLEIGSKVGLHNGFDQFYERVYFIVNNRDQEVRTVSTFADLAAPPGCVFAVVGNMAISYKIFMFEDKITGEISQYIYEISTFDLGGNGTTNNNEFKSDTCIAQNIKQFTQIFTPEELQRYRPTTKELNDLYIQLETFSRNIISFKDVAGTNFKPNEIDGFVKLIENYVKTNPQLKKNETSFYQILLGRFDTIFDLNNELRVLEGQPKTKGKQAEKIKEIKQERVNAFDALLSLLKERYIKIYETLAELQKKGEQIPPEITNEIIYITTFLQIVNGFSDVYKKTAQSTRLVKGDVSPIRRSFASTATSPMASPEKKVVGFGDPRAASFLALRTPQRTGLEERSLSMSSIGSVTKAKPIPYWYYLLTHEPSESWFRSNLPPKASRDVDDILRNFNPDRPEDIHGWICYNMAQTFCEKLSEIVPTAIQENDPNLDKIFNECIRRRMQLYSQLYYVGDVPSNRIQTDINAITRAMGTNAGGAKRTRKHKINKNRRKTKHINRKRKTKRLIKNKRRLTKKR